MRGVWMLAAPSICIGVVLERPLASALLVGGRFTAASGSHVALLLQVYFFALAGGTVGSITGRALYALDATRLVALVSAIEAVAYVLYTAALVHWLGATGVALGFVIFMTTPIAWHLAYIVRRVGWTSFSLTAWSAVRTTIAAAAGAAAAYLVCGAMSTSWMQLVAGGAAGVLVFAAVLPLANGPDARLLLDAMRVMAPWQRP
jgi:peptidoglycan biosynthesis protein MviN/MurJ (putative lipid II flippase)